MPDADSNRKRSRSPSDVEQQKQHKRANIGAQSASDDSQLQPAQVPLPQVTPTADVTMTDAPNADTAASTPSHRSDKIKEEQDASNIKNASDEAEGDAGRPSSTTSGAPSAVGAPPPSAMIHMRCLIVTQDASIIIGKGGSHVNEIREKSGARVMVSESIPGNPERILNVSGPLDAVSKVRFLLFIGRFACLIYLIQAFGLIVRRINDEPFDVPSVPGSRAVTIKFMIPNSRMGSVIGKQGSKIKEIQDASGARLNASEGMLPGSTEVRVLLLDWYFCKIAYSILA
jgi:heterogeneous nuclear rnp K-like protein